MKTENAQDFLFKIKPSLDPVLSYLKKSRAGLVNGSLAAQSIEAMTDRIERAKVKPSSLAYWNFADNPAQTKTGAAAKNATTKTAASTGGDGKNSVSSKANGTAVLERLEFSLPADVDKSVLDNTCTIDDDPTIYADLISLLVGEIGRTETPAGLMLPFVKKIVYGDERFLKLLSIHHANNDTGIDLPSQILGVDSFETMMVLHAYMVILQNVYKMDWPLEIRPVFAISEVENGVTVRRSYRMELDFRFAQVKVAGDAPELSQKDRALLTEHLEDLDLLKRLLPPEKFSIEGFLVARMREVTHEQLVTDLRSELTRVDSLTDTGHLARVQQHVRDLLKKQDLDLTLVTMTENQVFELHTHPEMCEYQGFRRSNFQSYEGSVFGAIHLDQKVKIVHDLSSLKVKTEFETELISYGVKGLMGIPLVLDGKTVGILVLSSTTAGLVSSADVINLAEVLPNFAFAVVRGMQQFESKVRTVIQEHFTSIHPSVEWKFRKLAVDHIMESTRDPEAALKGSIGFDNVWPLYGVSDIRSSSTFRNEAIRSDLQHQLGLARKVLAAAHAKQALPYLDELDFRLAGYLEHLAAGISSGDEIELLRFLASEVEPAMAGLTDFGAEVTSAYAVYKNALHAEHHSVYEKRRDFDQSVSKINRAISAYVDRVQPEAQGMFPHYFDKNSTDGVDMNMYVGPTLVADDSWRPMYLKNLRLWQFIVMARVARLAHRIKGELPLPLQTTHLVVVQDMPISIRFSDDEKRFAVDGAYNIRYEIMKKRIDKAVVKGSGERLTQPDKIAIVYSQHSERLEYERYIAYLQAKGYIDGDAEHLDLEDLQGISGLKALRVAVRMTENAAPEEESIIEMIRREFAEV